jgi:transglutaminase-like putative cysteine protease
MAVAALLLASALPLAASPTTSLFDAWAAALEGRFRATSAAPSQSALLVQLSELRPMVADRAGLDQFFAGIAGDSALPQIIRDAAAGCARRCVVSPALLTQAEERAATGDASALDALARLEHAANTGTPLAHMQAAAHQHPTAERWLLVARWSDAQPQIFAALSQALALDPDSADVRLAFADYYAGRSQTRKALELLRARPAPADFRVAWRIAGLEATLGHDAEANAEFDRLAGAFPESLWMMHHAADHAEDLARLDQAQALLTALLREDDNAEARAHLERVLAKRRDAAGLRRVYEEEARLHPDDPAPHRELARMDGALTEATAAVSDDSAYLVDAAATARAAQREKPAAREGATSLADIRVERVAANGLSTRHVQELTYLSSEEAARDYATREIQYAPATEQLAVLHARVFKRDGHWLDALDAGERNVADAVVAMYYDARFRQLRYRDLEPGDVVELEYRITPTVTANPYGAYLGELVPFQSSLPERLERYVLLAPEAMPLHVAADRLPAPQVAVTGGERRYRWEQHDIAPLVREPRAPALTEAAPYVHVSSFSSWQELGRWYAALIRPQLTVSDEMRTALAQALRGAGDEPARIRAIHQLVLKQTHYVALEFGIYGYQPYPVAQTFARRFGDCKDKASLMVALLHEAGIDADLALVRTRRLGAISEDATSVTVFDHAIVYVPKYDLWLDGTAEYSGSRELPLADQGAMALTVALDGRATLRHIPVSTADDNVTRRTVRAELHTDGTIGFSGSAYTRGEDAPGLRREYEIAERQRDSFRARLAEVFPAVQVEDVDVEGAHNLENDVTVNFRGTLDSFAGRKSLALAATWMPRQYLQTLAPLAQRSQPLLLPAPWSTEEDLRFELPRGARVASLPAPQTIRGDFGTAQLTFELRGRELRVHTEVQFRETRVEPQEYTAFRAFCSDVERAFRQEVKVVLP